ncbi:MAG: FHA domain-containing protein [Ectothiorhodospiraceae bacterium]|nr:FHA domain-containing protein [Chromatiales bacterium]MCP5154748.1 FHA domain-containing protein [Ectothiorhodospiraceae bacterium]
MTATRRLPIPFPLLPLLGRRGSRASAVRRRGAWSAERIFAPVLRALHRPERPRPLTLALEGPSLVFPGTAEFEFALAPRTVYPTEKAAALRERSPQELERIAHGVHLVEQRVADVLCHALAAPEHLTRLFASLEPQLFSHDHDWRAIAVGLQQSSRAADPYRRIVLVKYLQYLAARQQVLRGLHAQRIAAGEPSCESPAASPEATALLGPAVARAVDAEGMRRLPRGETVKLRFQEARAITIELADYRFRLHPGRRFVLADASGERFVLRPGCNLVGRQPDCDVVVNPAYQSVSRRHIIVQPIGEDRVAITDVSAHGTWVERECIESSIEPPRRRRRKTRRPRA